MMYDDIESVVNPRNVEGDMTIKNVNNGANTDGLSVNTLDEPVRDTILRDVNIVLVNIYHIMNPRGKSNILREWDLWGPLILCTLMATILQSSSDGTSNDGGPEFAEVFVIVWIGSMVVTLNSKLLGGNISFFQNVCVMGYCLLPLTIALMLCTIILFFKQTLYLFILRLLIGTIGFVWAVYASTRFLNDSQPERRKALAVYPMFLFYLIITWLILSHTR